MRRKIRRSMVQFLRPYRRLSSSVISSTAYMRRGAVLNLVWSYGRCPLWPHISFAYIFSINVDPQINPVAQAYHDYYVTELLRPREEVISKELFLKAKRRGHIKGGGLKGKSKVKTARGVYLLSVVLIKFSFESEVFRNHRDGILSFSFSECDDWCLSYHIIPWISRAA